MKSKKFTVLFLGILMCIFFAPVIKTNAAETTYEAQIGETYYTQLSTAFTNAQDGDTIYVLKDVLTNQTSTLSGSISVTLTSKPGSIFTIKRSSGITLLRLQNGAELTVENIIFDGDEINSSTGSLISVGAAGSASFIMKEGALITKGKTTNGAAAIQLYAGTLTVEGGTIKGNSSLYGISAIYAPVSTTVNLLGGEIFDNYTTNSDFGGIGIAGGATLNISGNAQVYNNSSNKNSDKRDIKFIDDASKVNVNVLDDFTGNIGIWSSKYYQRSNVFGQVLNNAEISEGTFINNRSNTLHGEKVSSDLIWEYDFENATIITYPTASSTGLIRQTAIGSPTITRDVTIDTLNTDTYTVEK